MIEQHLCRRSVSDFQRGVLALRKREILSSRKQHAAALKDAASVSSATEAGAPATASAAPAEPLPSREDLARAARLSSGQVTMIELIQKQATPELVAAVKSGTISINAAATVATLPAQEQVAAAQGGRKELQQAAKRVRASKKRDKVDLSDREDRSEVPAHDSVPALKARIAALETENAQLREQLAALR